MAAGFSHVAVDLGLETPLDFPHVKGRKPTGVIDSRCDIEGEQVPDLSDANGLARPSPRKPPFEMGDRISREFRRARIHRKVARRAGFADVDGAATDYADTHTSPPWPLREVA